MSKANAFAKTMESSIAELVKNATIHKDTHHVAFATPTLPKGITAESLTLHNDFVNQVSVAAEAALSEIAIAQYPDTKVTDWDGELSLVPGIDITATAMLKTTVGEETMYGITDLCVDHVFNEELSSWYGEFQGVNQDRVKKLFD